MTELNIFYWILFSNILFFIFYYRGAASKFLALHSILTIITIVTDDRNSTNKNILSSIKNNDNDNNITDDENENNGNNHNDVKNKNNNNNETENIFENMMKKIKKTETITTENSEISNQTAKVKTTKIEDAKNLKINQKKNGIKDEKNGKEGNPFLPPCLSRQNIEIQIKWRADLLTRINSSLPDTYRYVLTPFYTFMTTLY